MPALIFPSLDDALSDMLCQLRRSGLLAAIVFATCGQLICLAADGVADQFNRNATPQVINNTVQFPQGDATTVWNEVVDTIDDYYPIERNSPPNGLGNQSPSSRLQTFALLFPRELSVAGPDRRRWVGVSMQHSANGCLVEVSVFVEVQPLLRAVGSVDETWQFEGRDTAEEQRLIAVLVSRQNGAVYPATVGPDSSPPWMESKWPRLKHVGGNVLSDYANFYSPRSLLALGTVFGVGAAIANTDADQSIRSAWQHGIGTQPGIHAFKTFGEGLYTLPAYAAIAIVGNAFDQTAAGNVLAEYGGRGLRTALVGGPVLLLTQEMTGGSRPNENPWGSHWNFFGDNNGVSGHAFIGAIPFITAAKMTERPVCKVALYGLSVMPGLSRINDDAHYPSQVFLGYSLALIAATAVDNTQHGKTRPILIPWSIGKSSGMGIDFRY